MSETRKLGKALAEYREKWGHACCCNCCGELGGTIVGYEYEDLALPIYCTEETHAHPYRDPRCAPEKP